eukprot:1171690-Alexandrium_andersonii.AAC.1
MFVFNGISLASLTLALQPPGSSSPVYRTQALTGGASCPPMGGIVQPTVQNESMDSGLRSVA